MDLDGTICTKEEGQEYINATLHEDVVQQMRRYKEKGYYIIISTSRNMRTHNGNIGKINADTLKTIHDYLEKHNIPFDEIHIGKPWCSDGFYVDDRSIRPDEFVNLSEEEINVLFK
ncbi:HAD family hydrolase [Candidatus Woesearchaeota archaeon]|nr:HAD family hydrolase [Candidatus Woesearchaeota archaeon]